MDLQSFFTLQLLPQTDVKNSAGKAGDAPVQIHGAGFIDFILARLAENADKDNKDSLYKHELLQSDNPVLEKDPEIDLAAALAETLEIEEEIERHVTDPDQALSETLAMNQKAFDDILKPLTDGVITLEEVRNGSPQLMQALLIETEISDTAFLNRFEHILEKIEKLAVEDSPVLIVTNMTPEQMGELRQYFASKPGTETDIPATEVAFETEIPETGAAAQPPETVEEPASPLPYAAIALHMIKIVPPQTQREIVVTAGSLIIAPRPLGIQQSDSYIPANDLGAKLNALITNSGETNAKTGTAAVPETTEDGFEHILKQFTGEKPEKIIPASTQPPEDMPTVKPDLSTLQGWPFTSGSLFASMSWLSGLMDQYGTQNTLNVTNLNTLTNPVTQSQSAAHPHPATQMVAATIQKAAGTGENKNIVLQLEPPELGRVEVRMTFGKDKMIKAILISEKPETHIMLQRDSHTLERALQEIGLDSEGGLSFEMAGDDHEFSHDGSHDGSQGGSGSGENAEGEEDIIQSTMTWYVDPDTGLMRYDMLV